jgi:hypothetical protein
VAFRRECVLKSPACVLEEREGDAGEVDKGRGETGGRGEPLSGWARGGVEQYCNAGVVGAGCCS